MSRKTISIAVITLTVVVLVCFYFGTRQKINKIKVTVDNSLSADKVKIEKGFYSINSDSDQYLVKTGLDDIVFLKKSHDGFETICGENDFYVNYDNEYYTIIRHFIPNDFFNGVPKPHTYNFHFHKQADKIKLTIEIVGPDGIKFEGQLKHISTANENRWGKSFSGIQMVSAD